jgi:hypothetical protein
MNADVKTFISASQNATFGCAKIILMKVTFLVLFSIIVLVGKSQQSSTSIDFSAGSSLNFVFYKPKNESGPLGAGEVYSISNAKPLAGVVARFMIREKLGKKIFTRFGIAYGNYRTSLNYNLHTWVDVFADCYYWNEYTRISYATIQVPLTLGVYMDRKHVSSISFGFVPEFLIANHSTWKYTANCDYFFPPDTPYTENTAGEEKLKVKSGITFEIGLGQVFPLSETIAIITDERFHYRLGYLIDYPSLKQFDIELAVGFLLNLKKK